MCCFCGRVCANSLAETEMVRTCFLTRILGSNHRAEYVSIAADGRIAASMMLMPK